MTVPGEVTLDEMKLLLERAHKGEIIPLYVFAKRDNKKHEYYRRCLTQTSSLTQDLVYRSWDEKEVGAVRDVNMECGWVHIFTNYWFAYAFCIKNYGRIPEAAKDGGLPVVGPAKPHQG